MQNFAGIGSDPTDFDGLTSLVKYPPEGLRLVRAWDLASSAESNGDYTVGLLMGKDPETELIYVIDVMRGHWSPATLRSRYSPRHAWMARDARS